MKENKRLKFSRLGGMGLPVARHFMTQTGVSGQYIPFTGDGLQVPSPNLYPQVLADLTANASTHGAAINRKGILTFGQGIDFSILPDDLVEFLMHVNDNDESINDILNKIGFDLVTFGGATFKVYWNGDRTVRAIEHTPFKNVRLGVPNSTTKEIDYYIISNNWDNKLDRRLEVNERINKFNPGLIDKPEIVDGQPIFNETTSENAVQMVYYKTYSTAGNGFYPVPDYAQCLDAAFNEISTGVAMNNVISNGINGAYIVSTDENTVLDDDSKQAITDELNNFVSGPENAGGIMFMPANVKVSALEGLRADTYTEVNNEVRQRLITGHGVPSILLEYSASGGFNNRGEEMTTALLQFQQSTIKRYQQQLIRVLNGVIDWVTNEEFDLQIIPFIQDPSENDNINVEDSTSLNNQ